MVAVHVANLPSVSATQYHQCRHEIYVAQDRHYGMFEEKEATKLAKCTGKPDLEITNPRQYMCRPDINVTLVITSHFAQNTLVEVIMYLFLRVLHIQCPVP